MNGTILRRFNGDRTNLNPRKIIFLEVLNFKKGKGGISTVFSLIRGRSSYYVALDGDYDNQVGVSTNGTTSSNATIMKKVGVWNENANSRQQVRSWD